MKKNSTNALKRPNKIDLLTEQKFGHPRCRKYFSWAGYFRRSYGYVSISFRLYTNIPINVISMLNIISMKDSVAI